MARTSGQRRKAAGRGIHASALRVVHVAYLFPSVQSVIRGSRAGTANAAEGIHHGETESRVDHLLWRSNAIGGPMRRRLLSFASKLSLLLGAAVLLLWLRSCFVADQIGRDVYSVKSGAFVHHSLRLRAESGELLAVVITDSNSDPTIVTPRMSWIASQPGMAGAAWYWRVEPASSQVVLSPMGYRPAPHLGFFAGQYRRQFGFFGVRRFEVLVPAWSLAVAFSLLPLARVVARSRELRRQARIGLCRRCGYDLRGNVSGRCPECGTACRSPLD